MENEHELSYETLTRVYLGSYEHYKSVGADVEYPEPGFELQGAKMVEMGSYGADNANEVLVTKGALKSEVGHLDMLEHEVAEKPFIYNVVENTCNEAKLYDMDETGEGIVKGNILYIKEDPSEEFPLEEK
ncbi:hypothetical protein Tco_1263238 [Tanacetum coccineum]